MSSTESQLDAKLRDRYAVLVDERNAARRELETARAWMRIARHHLLMDADMYDELGSDASASVNRAVADRCPLPEEVER